MRKIMLILYKMFDNRPIVVYKCTANTAMTIIAKRIDFIFSKVLHDPSNFANSQR